MRGQLTPRYFEFSWCKVKLFWPYSHLPTPLCIMYLECSKYLISLEVILKSPYLQQDCQHVDLADSIGHCKMNFNIALYVLAYPHAHTCTIQSVFFSQLELLSYYHLLLPPPNTHTGPPLSPRGRLGRCPQAGPLVTSGGRAS